MFRNSLIVIFISFLVFACSNKNESKEDLSSIESTEFAKGFTIKKIGASTEVTLLEPYPNSSTVITYLLVPKDEEIPPHGTDVSVIRTPIESIVCTSTSHIALLDHLNALDKLVGFPSTDLISSSKARQRIDSGYVTDLGIDNAMNIESLVGLQPDLVMGYSIAGDMSKLDKIKSFGIPVVINAEFLENHPLGRAEWIKYMALFLGKEDKADSIFAAIKNEYLSNLRVVENINTKPTVISGILYGDAWFLPGGQNYGAKIFSDAGYRYLWDDDTSNGFLKLSFETVLSIGKEADYWIGVGNFKSKEEMKSSEGRYTLFKSFERSSVYTYDARVGAMGGSEYLELGYSRPDIILKDLIKIAHPELLPDYTLYFHKKLD
ncbi:MAG: ABC transporter substrate-binding protein [Cyclobacteriaceae bacterium]